MRHNMSMALATSLFIKPNTRNKQKMTGETPQVRSVKERREEREEEKREEREEREGREGREEREVVLGSSQGDSREISG